MLTSAAFDTLGYFDRLTAAGALEVHARVQAELFREQADLQAREIQRAIERYDESRRAELSTREDVQEVRLEIEKVRAETEKVRLEIRETEARLRTEIEKAKYDLLKWQIGGWLALAAIMAKGFGWLGF